MAAKINWHRYGTIITSLSPYAWPWIDHCELAMQYMYFRFGNDIIFYHDGLGQRYVVITAATSLQRRERERPCCVVLISS